MTSTGTKLRVDYIDGEPRSVKCGVGYFGEAVSKAAVDSDGTAVVMFDNCGSTDFVRELKELPFIDEVIQNGD